MDVKQIVILVLMVSILATVVGFGLKTAPADLLYLMRRPGLLVRSLLAMFVVMPLVAVVLVKTFNFPPAVNVVLIALAISPVPPILPKRESGAGGYTPYALGLMAFLGLLAIVMVPMSLEVMERVSGRSSGIEPREVAGPVVRAILIPLAFGMAIRAWLPAFAARIERVVTLVGAVLLPLGALALVIATASAIWALIGQTIVSAIVIFTIAGLAVGHVLGGPDRDHSTVLALSTACRHPAIALAVASALNPDERFLPLVLLYVIVSALVSVPYLTWQGYRVRRVARTA